MSKSKKKFECTVAYHRTKETFKAKDLGHGVYLGVYAEQELPFGEIYEQTTSIVMPKSELPFFIKFLKEVERIET